MTLNKQTVTRNTITERMTKRNFQK